jgi:hypothetical protein
MSAKAAGQQPPLGVSKEPIETRGAAKKEREDPSVPLFYRDRVVKALALVKDPPPDWKKEDCYSKMYVKKTSFYRFANLEKQGQLVYEKISTRNGRPSYLTEEAKQELYDEVTRLSLNLEAPPDYKIFYELVVAQIQAAAFNKLAEVAPAKTFMKCLKKELFVVVPHACLKNEQRRKQFENVRNALSFAAALHAYMQRQISLDMWCSFDDVTVLLNPGDKPKVITTKTAQQILHYQNISVSTNDTKDQRRVITFSALIAPDGSCLARMAKISDRLFKDYISSPGIFSFGEGEQKLHVVLTHPTLKDSKLYEKIFKKVIIPAALAHQERHEKASTQGLEHFESSEEQSQGHSSAAPPCARTRKERLMGADCSGLI